MALSQFNVVAGILVAYLSNYFIAGALGGPESEAWRVMLGVPAVPAALVKTVADGLDDAL